jgi:hypothetical protein
LTDTRIESIPPNLTPLEALVFENTKTAEFTISINVTSPFVISKSNCRELKPGRHCRLDLTYTAQTVGNKIAVL